MAAGKAIGIAASGFAGAVVMVLCSMLSKLPTGNLWLWVTVLFGGTIGLSIGHLLTKAQERNADVKKQMDTSIADLRKSIQDYQLLIEKHERDEKTFTEQLRLHEQVFNTMSSGVIVCSKDGEILLANRSAYSLLCPDTEFTTESLNDVLPYFDVWPSRPDSRDRSMSSVRLRDGTNRLFEFSKTSLNDGGLVIVFQDITVAVEIQERKQRSEELALVGEMVSRLSHEIKNPLASILLGVKTLQRDAPQLSHHGQILQLISEEVDSLMKIVNQLLESARPRTPCHRPAYVEPLLERCVDAHGFEANQRGVRLEIVPFSVSTPVLVDEQSMLRGLGSLIQNALDACSRGDVIRVGWQELDQARKDELVPGFPGKVVSVYVEDNGRGVPHEISSSESRIFKAFVSTKASGSGLGLTVAQEIVEDHGGVIVVSSRSHPGTIVEILLPIPEGIPCWDWNSGESVDCTSCEVKSKGTGYFCWKQKQGASPADAARWPARCLKCDFFRASSLTPFFRSRLVVPKAE